MADLHDYDLHDEALRREAADEAMCGSSQEVCDSSHEEWLRRLHTRGREWLGQRTRDLTKLFLLKIHQNSATLYGGCDKPLAQTLNDIKKIWGVAGRNLREIREWTADLSTRGFTSSQIEVITMFFWLRVVFHRMPSKPNWLYDLTRGLWSVVVDVPENAQFPWRDVCAELASRPWISDPAPLSALDCVMEKAIADMHTAKKGAPRQILDSVVDGEDRYSRRMALDAQIPIRCALARFESGHFGDFISTDDLVRLFDNMKLISIKCITGSNQLYDVTNTPKGLYGAANTGPFLLCVIQTDSEPISEACIELGFVYYLFGSQDNFSSLFTKAPFK